MVWYDPTLIQREVWVGTAVVSASVAFTVFSLYATLSRSSWLRRYRLVVVLTGWVILFAVQLAYLSSSSTILYGVYYDEVLGNYIHYTTSNPMGPAVVGVTVATAVVCIATSILAVVEEFRRVHRRVLTGWVER